MTPSLDDFLQELKKVLEPAHTSEKAAQATGALLQRYSQGGMLLPERARRPCATGYARHLIQLDGHCVVAMVWDSQQGTPVHDHGGVWCVEACLEGRLEITNYRLVSETRLEPERRVEVGRGAVGCLIPPFEHHKLYNPFPEQAVTLHVYGQELHHCTRFLEESPGVFHSQKVALTYTSRPED